jgi:hypothetical protein
VPREHSRHRRSDSVQLGIPRQLQKGLKFSLAGILPMSVLGEGNDDVLDEPKFATYPTRGPGDSGAYPTSMAGGKRIELRPRTATPRPRHNGADLLALWLPLRRQGRAAAFIAFSRISRLIESVTTGTFPVCILRPIRMYFVVRRLKVVIEVTLLLECGLARRVIFKFELEIVLGDVSLEPSVDIIIRPAHVGDPESTFLVRLPESIGSRRCAGYGVVDALRC